MAIALLRIGVSMVGRQWFNPYMLIGKIVYILTSTKNASLSITDFLAMIKVNEQRRTASLYRGWAMLENDFNLICR